MSTISISIQFYPCTIISLIITIHFLFLYRRPATDYEDSLRRDRYREGGSGSIAGEEVGSLFLFHLLFHSCIIISHIISIHF